VQTDSPTHFPAEKPARIDLMQDRAQTPTKVIIFEGSEMGCQLLSHELEKSVYGIEVVGCRSSSPEVDPNLVRTADVALISSNLRDGPLSGFKVLRSLRSYKSTLRSVMLLDHDDPDLVLEAFRYGASGVFERDASCESLCKCIRRVHDGQVWANNQQVLYLIQALKTASTMTKGYSRLRSILTRREEDIVKLVLEGKTNREIALALGLSEHTVKNHLFRLFMKVGVSSRSELMAYSLQQTPISDEPRSA
jgi:DNA-binding NarL/FixJ family response regulator